MRFASKSIFAALNSFMKACFQPSAASGDRNWFLLDLPWDLGNMVLGWDDMNFQFCGETRSLVGEITEAFLPYAEAAVLRLQILYPDVSFSLDGNKIAVREINEKSVPVIRSAIAHQIYREKILVETLSLRKSLLSAVIK